MKLSSLKFILLLTLVAQLSGAIARAQDEKFEALFIYNFTKYIEWPFENQSSEFVITVLGNGDIIPELASISSRMSANSKTIIIKKASSPLAIPPSQILFVTKERTNEIPQIIENIKNRNILLIAEKPNACALGAAVNFVSKGGNLSFELSRGNLEKYGLKVNTQLLTLGTLVK
jgi:YfiR/HmsC-like